MSRIDNIKTYKKRKRETEYKELFTKTKKFEKLEIEIRALQPRIRELIDTANACIQNEISIDHFKEHGWAKQYDTYEKGTFVTNKMTNRLGFVDGWKSGTRLCFSEIGYDTSISWDFRTDGTVIRSVHKDDMDEVREAIERHMEQFLRDFETFETAFYNYIDKITEQGE